MIRPPQSLGNGASSGKPLSPLEYELMSERADSLGRTGLKAEAALARLKEAGSNPSESLLQEAADCVYALIIQREICGLKNGREIIAHYGIPGTVLVRLGAAPKKST
jgi:hypothetical protein